MKDPKARAPGQTQFTFSLSEELKTHLQTEAARQKRTVSNLIVWITENYFEQQQKIQDEPLQYSIQKKPMAPTPGENAAGPIVRMSEQPISHPRKIDEIPDENSGRK